MGGPKMAKPRPDARIIKMREYEEKLRSMKDVVKDAAYRDELAHWEVKTDAKIKHNEAMLRFEQLKAVANEALDARRMKLAEKLYAEDQGLQHELANSRVKPEDVRAQMVERALTLKAEKEAERAALARELSYRRWREDCDALRIVDSMAALQVAVVGRDEQVVEKAQQMRSEAESQVQFDAMYERERLKKEQRYQNDQRNRRLRDEEAVRALNDQRQFIREKALEAKKNDQKEVEEMKRRWAEEDRAAEAAAEAVRQRNEEVGQELRRFNEEKQEELLQARLAEEELDARAVAEAMQRVQEEEEREAEAKDRRKEEARMYAQHLKIIAAFHKESEEEFERIVEDERLKMVAKKDAEDREAKAMKARLYEEVSVARQAQIEEKAAYEQMLIQARERDRLLAAEEYGAIRAVENERALALRAERKRHQLEIKAQIAAKTEKRQQELLQKERDFQGAVHAEQAYLGMIQRDQAVPPPAPNFGRKSTKWYS